MNISISECSSGCESGWTMYLDQSSNSGDHLQKSGCGYEAANVEDYDEDEDLSMVSDASSGPPHFQEDEDLFDESGYKHIAKPLIGASVEHTTGLSQGFSATHFKGKSTSQKKLGFLHSSVPGKPASGPTGRDLQ
ncbi:hypothetical protein Acr_04g0006980 [Actinidia rufa]|uniref:Uncharacterized protein n=1 Tax=Actinidia rufa TaxID=165716 RepID=A0A7J0EHV6_9ERIC|nr:hypothetical protein Acr_04g0006980 [Actinidia rufa]